MEREQVVVIGAGLGGLAAAITAAHSGSHVTLIERGAKFGGAAAFSGGQVWVGANRTELNEGADDRVDATLQYVEALAMREPSVFERDRAIEWIVQGSQAAAWFEDIGAVSWTVIPDYPDYYWPDIEGARPWGRYLTGAPFDGRALGDWRPLLLEGPHFPVGITYAEQFELGGLSRKAAFASLLAERRAADSMTYGQGLAASFGSAARRAGVVLRPSTEAIALLENHEGVCGVRVRGSAGEEILEGPVIIATGAHDWNADLQRRLTGLAPDDCGSVAPSTLHGDAFHLAESVGAASSSIPAWAAPVLPGYRLPSTAFEGDSGFRPCYEHCVPHTFIVNRRGARFCDDSFHARIVASVLDSSADRPNLPMFMIWDEQHHQKYGLGTIPPGGQYPRELVVSASTLAELARALGIDPEGLESTTARFNEGARAGRDPEFGRGANASVRRFRGDNSAAHPNIGPVEEAPFHGMRLRLLNTGIACGGVRTTDHGRVLRDDGTVIDGLYAVGEAAVRSTGGGGYNSGYSLSRAMVFGWLAARHATAVKHERCGRHSA